MRTYRVEVMAAMIVVSSALVNAALPFKAAEIHVRRPVTIRRQEDDWIRVTENNPEKREFAYVVRR